MDIHQQGQPCALTPDVDLATDAGVKYLWRAVRRGQRALEQEASGVFGDETLIFLERLFVRWGSIGEFDLERPGIRAGEAARFI